MQADEGTTAMTVAEVTATPSITGVAPPGTDVTLEFCGRFRVGIDQWAYVPFDVPPGVRRITVSTAHDQFLLCGVARNVLDLGIFGPAGYQLGNVDGFRGWSGGARSGFTLSAGDATPGYLAGPIEPGRWALALGPVVLNPLGMRWRARIVLEYGAPSAGSRRRCAAAAAWWWRRTRRCRCRAGPGGSVTGTSMRSRSGTARVDDEVSLRMWHRLLKRGRFVAAVGGIDSHGPHQRVGLPQTVVHATELSRCALVDALCRGRSYIAESDEVTVNLTASCTDGGETFSARPGDTLSVPPGAAVTVSASVSGAPVSRLALITASGCAAGADLESSGRVGWHGSQPARKPGSSGRRFGAPQAAASARWLP
jgi:hypothetical protein